MIFERDEPVDQPLSSVHYQIILKIKNIWKKYFWTRSHLSRGGSYGIGRATAIAFARRGATVVIADCSEDKEGTTLRRVKEAGGEGMFIQCNVGDAAQVKEAIKKNDRHLWAFGLCFQQCRY